MDIRSATLPDLNACFSVDHDVMSDHVWQMQVHKADSDLSVAFQTVRLPRPIRIKYPRDLEQLLEDWQRGECFLVAEVDGEVRGYIDLIAQPWQGLGWVANLAVARAYRRRGIATELVRNAGWWARDQGLEALLLEATTKNHPALSLYQKLGFCFCGYHDRYYPNQDIALFFAQYVR